MSLAPIHNTYRALGSATPPDLVGNSGADALPISALLDELLPLDGLLATTDDEIEGRHIPAGTLLVCSIFALHRRPELWPSPLVFDPERFLPERRKAIEPGAYAPFGAGPRLCMGNHFALAEGAVMLSTLARRFDVALDDASVGVTKLPGSLRPDRPVRLRLAKRARPGVLAGV